MLKDFCIWGLRGLGEKSVQLGYYCEITACLLEDIPKEVAAVKAIAVLHKHADKIAKKKEQLNNTDNTCTQS